MTLSQQSSAGRANLLARPEGKSKVMKTNKRTESLRQKRADALRTLASGSESGKRYVVRSKWTHKYVHAALFDTAQKQVGYIKLGEREGAMEFSDSASLMVIAAADFESNVAPGTNFEREEAK